MDISGDWVFHPGVLYRGRRRPNTRIRLAAPTPATITMWEQRRNHAPESGTIRLFDPPPAEAEFNISILWARDLTLTEWIDRISQCHTDVSENPIVVALRPPDYMDTLNRIFTSTQRQRWLARVTLLKWTQHVWRKRTQCNIDMIDMQPIADADAIFMTDTTHRQIFRFHRHDVFTNLISNICMSDDMLPAPRTPTNPWTNSPMTLGQTIGICQQLITDFGKRGKCPPVMFAAFWASRFSLKRFLTENSAILAQHAIASYFKDLHSDNMMTVFDTITILLTNAHLDFSYTAIRRWLRQTPTTHLHREWLQLVQDYTLYINMHVQPRVHWYSEEMIYADVRRLYGRTVLPDAIPAQVRIINNLNAEPERSYLGVLGLPIVAELAWQSLFDISGTDTDALQLIQSALFR